MKACSPSVLIETLWNVKFIYNLVFNCSGSVLIETLWNVKIGVDVSIFSLIGINRNIVECKGAPTTTAWTLAHCINRNIVECKEGTEAGGNLRRHSINRNIVECKVYFDARPDISLWRINRNIVECKDGRLSGRPGRRVVLIETLWNVKTEARHLEKELARY